LRRRNIDNMPDRENKDDRARELRRSLQQGDLDGARRILGSAKGERCFASRPTPSQPVPNAPHSLQAVWGGEEVLVSTSRGQVPCWRSEPEALEIDPAAGEIASLLASCMKGGGERFDELRASPGLCHLADAAEEQVVFLRSHSVGGKSGMTAAISKAISRDGVIHVTQHVARSPREEPGVLQLFADACEWAGVVVMFGGRSDSPKSLQRRMKSAGLDEPWGIPPVMLVRDDCKAMWGDEMPRFGLRVIEQMGLGRSRPGGFPPSVLGRVVKRFHETGDARAMAKLLRRSVCDLLVLIETCCFLLTGRGPVGAY
ncbi:MAG: hypothetical protein ACOCWV_06520, partial [Planctomycetota bacterium]